MIGMACRCAGAADPDEYWALMREGKDCIQGIEDPGWLDFFAAHSDKPVPLRYGRLQGKDYFDAAFFGIGPDEAAAMDFPQRVLLEDAYRALEDAGIDPSSLQKQPVGIFIGSVGGGARNADLSSHSVLATDTSVLSSRIAYFLDLKGPALTVNTACSSSLVAMDVACRYLRSGDIDLAIVGGVTIYTDPRAFVMMNRAGMLSPTANCRPFDDRADGMVVGDGSGILILKRLGDAERDMDPVHGVVAAIGTNQNGQTAGMTVPSYLSQSRLQSSLYRAHGIDVEDIRYVETHGTATKLGDPIEIDALNHSFRQFTAKKHYCAIGSVKANIGHTTAASGVLSVIKVLLAFKHRLIPPSLNFERANEHIDFENSPFQVNTVLREWPDNAHKPRMAAVTSLGHSGTNAHLVLEEYRPVRAVSRILRPAAVLVPLSAQTAASLGESARRLARFFRANPTLDLNAVAYTLQAGRAQMRHRAIFLVETLAELADKLEWLGRCDESPSRRKETIEQVWLGEGKPRGRASSVANLESLPSAVLAERWAGGESVDWRSLYRGGEPRRLHLPGYVFAKTCDAGRPEIATQAAAEHGLPREDKLERLLENLLSETLACPVDGIEPDRNFFELGLNSLGVVRIQKSLENIAGRKIGSSILFEYPTVERLSACLRERYRHCFDEVSLARHAALPNRSSSLSADARFPELILLNDDRRGRPVFWFHGGLGGVQPYQVLAEASARPFYGIQARGWMGEHDPIYGVPAMASHYIEAMQSVQPKGPYDLGGYSLGGLLAYEVTRQLQAAGETVATVVMLDTFDTRKIKEVRQSRKDDLLQAVNIALQTRVMQNPEAFSSILIHRDELDLSLDDEACLQQLIGLAKTRGLPYTEEQMRGQIRKQSAVQSAHQAHLYDILPLPDAGSVDCVYFRNRNGVYMGELEPYFVLHADELGLDHADHWRLWRTLFPKFSMIDVDASNHLVLLAEPGPCEILAEFCRGFYSGKDLAPGFLQDFRAKARV